MRKIDLGQSVTILANIGVIAGLLFLAIEIQQSNRLAIASTEIEVRNSLAAINESIYTNTGIAEILIKLTDPAAELTPVEQLKIYMLVARLANSWLAVETAFENDMVPPETYESIEDDIRNFLIRYPAARPIMRQVIDNHPALESTEVFDIMQRYLDED